MRFYYRLLNRQMGDSYRDFAIFFLPPGPYQGPHFLLNFASYIKHHLLMSLLQMETFI